MEKKISLVLFSLLLTTGFVFGQEYTFKVLANKGQNKVKKPSGELVTLKTGALLFDQEEIISSEGAYIGLMHKTGKTTEVRGAGTKRVAELASKINTKKTSAASRYAQFVASKMAEGDKESFKNRTITTGAVSRGAAGTVLFPPLKSLPVYSDEVVLRWIPSDSTVRGETKYAITIMNIFDEVLYTEETTKESFRLKFDEIGTGSGLYIFKVNGAEDQDAEALEVGLKKIEGSDKPAVAQGLEGLMPDLTDESPLTNLMLAQFYEENGLLLDAFTQYEEALQGAPEVDDFRDIYEDFLLRTEFVRIVDSEEEKK